MIFSTQPIFIRTKYTLDHWNDSYIAHFQANTCFFFSLYIKLWCAPCFVDSWKIKSVFIYIYIGSDFFAQMYMNVLCNAWTVKYYKLKWINSTLGLFVPLSCQMTCTDGEKHFIRSVLNVNITKWVEKCTHQFTYFFRFLSANVDKIANNGQNIRL